jgi:hypothetical protein
VRVDLDERGQRLLHPGELAVEPHRRLVSGRCLGHGARLAGAQGSRLPFLRMKRAMLVIWTAPAVLSCASNPSALVPKAHELAASPRLCPPVQPASVDPEVWQCMQQIGKGLKCFDCCTQVETDFRECKQVLGPSWECANAASRAITKCQKLDCEAPPGSPPCTRHPNTVPFHQPPPDGKTPLTPPDKKRFPHWPYNTPPTQLPAGEASR